MRKELIEQINKRYVKIRDDKSKRVKNDKKLGKIGGMITSKNNCKILMSDKKR